MRVLSIPLITAFGLVLSLAAPASHGGSDTGSTAFNWQQARLALAGDDFKNAQEMIQGWLMIFPDVPAFHLGAARIERNLGNFKAAEEHLNRCNKLKGEETEESQLERLLVQAQTGKFDEVEER